MTIAFIGAGTVGTALGALLQRKGYQVVAVSSRSRASAERFAARVPGARVCASNQGAADAAELVFVTTPDDTIAPVVASLRWRQGQMVVHCSGADSLDILEPARQAGAEVGSLHPLQTLASLDQAIVNIPGSVFALEGEGHILDTLKELAQALGGTWVRLGPGDKALYHAAAVIACNYLYTLAKLATDLWQTFGVPKQEAIQALLPLLRGTLNNLERVGLPQALTGPIARGDLGTLRRHLQALETRLPEVLPAYRELGLQTIPIALAKGRIDEARAREMTALLAGQTGSSPKGKLVSARKSAGGEVL